MPPRDLPQQTDRPSQPRASFLALYEAHLPLVCHVVRLSGVRQADIEDVAQDVMATMGEELRAGRLDTSGSLKPWLVLTTRRRAKDWKSLAMHRERTVPGERQVGDVMPDHHRPDPERASMLSMLRDHAVEILGTLPEEQREVLLLAEVHEMSMPEVAEALGIPLNTGYSRLRLAKESFRKAWDDRRYGRVSTALAVAPFASWGAEDLLKSQAAVPPISRGVGQAVLGKLAASGLVGGAAVAGGVGASAAVAGSSALSKVVAAAVLGAAVGAGALAGAERMRTAPPPPEPVAVAAVASAAASARPVETSAASAAAPEPAPAVSASAPARRPAVVPSAPSVATASAAPNAVPTASDVADEDRMHLKAARQAINQGNLDVARAHLAAVKSPRYAADRDALMARIPKQ